MHAYAYAPAGARNEAGTSPTRRLLTLAASGLAAAALSTAALLGAASPAHAHDELVGVAGELNESGESISLTLSFSNDVMEVGAESVVTGPSGADLAEGEPVISGRDLTQRIAMPGFDETITVAWRVVSSDGHPISGNVVFAVLERDGGTELEFREAPQTPANAGDPALEPPAGGMWSPAVLWTVFTIMLVAAIGTSAVVAVKRKRLKDGKASADGDAR